MTSPTEHTVTPLVFLRESSGHASRRRTTGMVSLHTLRRVLAIDLRLDAEGIDRCLSQAATERPWVEVTEIPLAEALRIIEAAEILAGPTAARAC